MFLLLDLALRYKYVNKLFAYLINFNFVPNYQIAFSLPVSGLRLSVLIGLVIITITAYLILNYKKLNSLEFISLILYSNII